MIECFQLALAKICLWSVALLLSVLVGWKSLKCLAWMLPLIERKPVRVVVFGAAICLGGLCVCISYGGSKTNAPPCGAANPPRLMAGPGAPTGESGASCGDGTDAAGLPGLQITDFTLETNGVTIGSCWNPDLWLTGLGLFHSPFVNSNDWEMLDQWIVSRDATNDVHAVPFGGAFTNSVAGFFRLYGYPDPERALYTAIRLTLLDPNAYNEVTITGEGGFASEPDTLRLEYGVTNEVLIRIGQRYTVEPWGDDTFALSSADPFVDCTEGEYDTTLSVCRPVRVLLSDIPPPEDAPRCSFGHVHARYYSFSTDPELRGNLAFYDTACIAVDNTNHTLRISTSWAPGHRSASRIREDYGALGTFTETNGTIDLVFDDLCPHSVGSGTYCFCGQDYYCPDCIGSTAAWHNLMFPNLLTATNAPGGSVSLDWHDGVASNAYYFVELATTNRSIRATISPRLPTMTRDYQVQTVPGLTARIPLLAGVDYTITAGGDFAVAAFDSDDVVTQISNRAYAVKRPLGFDVEEISGAGTNCVEGHIHARHYRITTSIPDIPGTIEFDDTKCFTPTGPNAPTGPNTFVVECDGHRGATCPTNGVITGRFIYEGVTKPFAITNAALCRCDNLHYPTCPCGEASLCDECDTTIYGQDENWVRNNFEKLRELDPTVTNVEDVLSVGYTNWVDGRVGYGLENGLYKFTATFTSAPSVPTRLCVGDYVVSVTNAGIYAFLLEKGVDYYFDTYPRAPDVSYSTRDDLAAPPMTTLLGTGLVGQPGVWTRGGGKKELTAPDGNAPGHVLQMPTLTATPDVAPLYPENFPKTFAALLSDVPDDCEVSYAWSGSPSVLILSPNAPSTAVYARFEDYWVMAGLSVTARIGSREITSYLNFCFGDHTGMNPAFSITAPEIVFLNDDHRTSRWHRVEVTLTSPVATNATVSFMNSQTTSPIYASDARGNNRIQLGDICLSTTAMTPVASQAFYFACEQIGFGSVFASCALENGGTLTDAAAYRVIEPLRKLVTTTAGPDGRPVNPSRLVYGTNAWLEVDRNGSFPANQIRWRVVSGPGEIVVTNNFRACVRPTAASGTVVVEAAFGSDSRIQPKFVLPIVEKKRIPVRVFYVNNENNVAPNRLAQFKVELSLANQIFSQVGVEFYQEGNPLAVANYSYARLNEHDVVIDLNGRRRQSPGLSSQSMSLLGMLPVMNNAVRVVYVHEITQGTSLAFSVPDFKVVIMGADGLSSVLAHELGHNLGLVDIYSRLKNEPNILMPGWNGVAYCNVFSCVAHDWGEEDGRAFYEVSDTHGQLVEQLLMNGINDFDGRDIPSGEVYGYPPEPANTFDKSMRKVGASTIREKL